MWFWLNKFWIGEMGAELTAMMSRHWHICSYVMCAQNAICDVRTLPSGLICRSSMQQYPFPRLVRSESMFSFQLPGLCLVTRYAKCCYYWLIHAHCHVASWEDDRIGREVFTVCARAQCWSLQYTLLSCWSKIQFWTHAYHYFQNHPYPYSLCNKYKTWVDPNIPAINS